VTTSAWREPRTVTPQLKPVFNLPATAPLHRLNTEALEENRLRAAQRFLERNPSSVLHGTPQAMLRSDVVVAFIVDGNGQVVSSSVYRSNDDSGAERTEQRQIPVARVRLGRRKATAGVMRVLVYRLGVRCANWSGRRIASSAFASMQRGRETVPRQSMVVACGVSIRFRA
jgi:hypothetical protein